MAEAVLQIDPTVRTQYMYELCESCAHALYDARRPTPDYARAVTLLLFGTIAHESGTFLYTRQHGFGWDSDRGAWGLAQCELGSVSASLGYLKNRPELVRRAAQWLAEDKDATLDWLFVLAPQQVLRLLPVSERLAVLFCRLHYFRVPESVPLTVAGMDRYYKQYYNTAAGKAQIGDFTVALNTASRRMDLAA